VLEEARQAENESAETEEEEIVSAEETGNRE